MRKSLALAFVITIAGLLDVGVALAETDAQRAGARAAATSGAQAYREERWADALDLMTRAESLVHSPIHLLYMARSSEKLGKLVRARELYMKISREDLPSDAPDIFVKAKSDAEAELAALEPRLPMLTVNVEGTEGRQFEVLMDGTPMPSALIGVPHPADPGEHEFQATADGVGGKIEKTTITEGGKASVALTLPAAPPKEEAAPAGAASGEASGQLDVTPTDAGGGGSSGMRIGSYVAFGVGAVGLGVGTVFALSASSKRSEADDICAELAGPGCPVDREDEVKQLDSDADSAATISLISFVAGGVGVVAGVTLFILSSDDGSSETAGTTIAPWVGPGSIGVSGTF